MMTCGDGVNPVDGPADDELTYIPRWPQALAAFECSSISSDIQRSPLAARVDQPRAECGDWRIPPRERMTKASAASIAT